MQTKFRCKVGLHEPNLIENDGGSNAYKNLEERCLHCDDLLRQWDEDENPPKRTVVMRVAEWLGF